MSDDAVEEEGLRERGKQLLDDLWRQIGGLSRAQKLALVFLGLVVTSALGAALLGGTGGGLDGGVSGGERQRAAAAGERARPVLERALDLARDEATLPDSADVVSWLYEGKGWLDFDSPQRFEAKLHQSRCKLIEQSIRWNESIQRAVIAVHRGASPRFAREKAAADSAAVVLRLADGCERLPESEARAIRSLVGGAFNLAPPSVAVVDHHFYCYEPRALPFPWEEEEDRWARKIETDVTGILSRSFSRAEFAVAAIVHLSGRTSRWEREEFAPGGVIASSTAGPFPSVEKSVMEIPAGEVLGVRVNVLLDLDAVRRLVAFAEPPGEGLAGLEGRQREFIAEQERFIRKLLPFKESEVAILAQPFVRQEEPPPSLAAAPRGGPAEAVPPPSERSASGEWWPAPLAGAASVLASGIVVLAALRVARRRRAGREEPAAPSDERGARGEDAATRIPSRQRTGFGSSGGSAASLTPEGFAGMEDMSSAVRERPEVAASVLRLWLAQDFEAREEALS